MGNICGRCCDNIQDWCRDSCGCCPCKCCKTTNVEIALKTVSDQIDKKKTIPYGYGRIYPGVRKADNSWSSPIFEIRTWRKETKQSNVNHATVSQRVALGGRQTERDNSDRHIGPLRGTENLKVELDEEIQCVPIDSIISIKYEGEVKKELTEQKHARLNTPPPSVPLSCCDRVSRWCCRTCCCCCNDSSNQVHIDPGRTITQIVGEKSERVILITIEYIRYHNIDTPSYFRALAATDAAVYYKEHLHTDTLKFYLINNQDFEQTDFDSKRAQGAALCRLVTQLKAMAGQYPDGSILENIISEHEIQVVGDPPKETMERLVGPGRTSASLEARITPQAIQN